MGIVHNNPMMNTTTGTVGPVYYRKFRGKLIVCNRPAKGGKRSPKQLANSQRFGEASTNAKHFLQDPAVKEIYKARTDNKKYTAHMVAQSEMMNPPKVLAIDTPEYSGNVGDGITVEVKHDLTIVKVVVSVISPSGEVIESGEAVKNHPVWWNWNYLATSSNSDFKDSTIRVEAFDMTGVSGKMELLL